MKKKNSLIIALVIFLSISCNFHRNDDEISQEVAMVLFKQEEAWNNKDLKGYLSGYQKDETLRFITSRRVFEGYADVERMYAKWFNGKKETGKLTFEIHETQRLNTDLVLVIGSFKLDYQRKKSDKGNFTLIFKKNKEDWKIILDHTS